MSKNPKIIYSIMNMLTILLLFLSSCITEYIYCANLLLQSYKHPVSINTSSNIFKNDIVFDGQQKNRNRNLKNKTRREKNGNPSAPPSAGQLNQNFLRTSDFPLRLATRYKPTPSSSGEIWAHRPCLSSWTRAPATNFD